MGAIGDSVGLLLKIRSDSSQAKSDISDFSSTVEKETKKIKSSGDGALDGFAQSLGLSADLHRCAAYQLNQFDFEQKEIEKRNDLRGFHYAIMAALAGQPLELDGDDDEKKTEENVITW